MRKVAEKALESNDKLCSLRVADLLSRLQAVEDEAVDAICLSRHIALRQFFMEWLLGLGRRKARSDAGA